MNKFKRQEKDYSCGAAALRNCIIALDKIVYKERTIRNKVGTTKDGGTPERGIVLGAIAMGYDVEVIETTNKAKFKRDIINGLKSGSVYIVLTDKEIHWIALVGYNNKYFHFVDSSFSKVYQDFTEEQFLKMVKNFDKEKRKEYFFAIQISRQ